MSTYLIETLIYYKVNLYMKKLLVLIFFGFLGLFLIFFPAFIHASGFTTAFLRLESKANSAIYATVCAQPSSIGAGTENKVIIVFPDDFTISANTSNWQTSTSDIPEGATAWPGIGSSANGVSGQSVTLTSGDLTSNLLYCFNLSSSLSLTGSSGNDKTGTISTRNSSNVLIDSTSYGLSVLSNNQISVTANVDPKISDLPIDIESETPGSDFPQDTTISYKITYGTNTQGSIPLTIQAQWTEGTIEGSPAPSVEILSYVVGSASNAYGATSPVIDTVNRTITWNINSIPGNTAGQTVTFKLKTNSAYTGPERVDFNVSGRAISGSTVTPDVNVSQTYLFDSGLATPTPTQTPGSGSSTSTPTPTPQVTTALKILDIFINSISQSDAGIFVTTNKSAVIKILYGLSPNSLNKSAVSLAGVQNLLTLENLEPGTDYFFRAIATDASGNSVTSDIFTFETAEVSEIPGINLSSLFVTSGDNVIFNPTFLFNKTLDKNIIVLPVNSVFTLQFSLDKIISLKRMQAIIRNARVLGPDYSLNPSLNYLDIVEIAPGVYTGKLVAPKTLGEYEIYVRLSDYKGNILEKKISDLEVTNKLSVFRKGSKNIPVENARMVLSLYNQNSKIYEPISPNILPIKNPSYSRPDGTFDLILPLGRYKAEIEAIGYDSKSVEFTIEPKGKNYPLIYLKQQPFNILNTTKYYLSTIIDLVNASQDYLIANSYSNRLFDLATFGTVFIFILISTLSISARTHITLFYLPYFLIFKLKILFKGKGSNIIFGKVIDEDTNAPLSRADVSIISKTGEILAKLKTNKLGEFYFREDKSMPVKIRVDKEGFEKPGEFTYEKTNEFPFILKIKNLKGKHYSPFWITFIYLEDFLGVCMEALILIGIIVQIYFVFTFGFLRVAPFLALTVLNLVLIFTFLYKPKALVNS